jgi:hypothetical protein
VAFRPRLHRLWGVLLVGLHLATELAMRISFVPSAVVVAVLFVGSPIAPAAVRVNEALLDLPGVFALRRRLQPAPTGPTAKPALAARLLPRNTEHPRQP